MNFFRRPAVFLNILFVLVLLASHAFQANASERQDEYYKIIGTHASGSSIAETRDGYIVAGSASDKDGQCCLGWAVKIDKSGDKLWEKTIGESYNYYNFVKAAAMGDRAVLAGATDISYKPQWQAGTFASASGWVVKLAEDGSVEWEKKLRLKERLEYEDIEIEVMPSILATDAKAVGDKIIIAGFLRYGISDTPIIWMLDAKGEVVWERRIEVEREHSIWPDVIIPLRDGGIVIEGDLIDRNNNSFNTWLAYISARGKVLWERKFDSNIDKKFVSTSSSRVIAELKDGSIITGNGVEYLDIKEINEDMHSTQRKAILVRPLGGSVWLSKLANNGDLKWRSKINIPGICGIKGLWTADKDEIVAVGQTCENEQERIWAATLSSSGKIKSIKKFLPVKNAHIHQAIPAGDGAFIAVGNSHEKESDSSSTWIYRTKFNSNAK